VKCNRTLHDEFRHGTASAPPDCRIRQSVSASAVPLRPRLATTHSFLVWRDSSFLFSVWWWRARSGFSKGETDGILVPIRWTKFWQDYFLGKGFAKTSAHLFLNLDVANGKGGVWGGIFHLLRFLFWRNSGRTENRKEFNIVSIISLLVFVRDYGVHPRHSPRTFPLGLLAPRCLGLAHLLALPLCGAGARAPCCLREGRNPSPSFGLLLAVVYRVFSAFIRLMVI